jgi:hypothetical protein
MLRLSGLFTVKRTPQAALAVSPSPCTIPRWQMDEGRRRRLAVIGFPDDEAAELSALHTRNFM